MRKEIFFFLVFVFLSKILLSQVESTPSVSSKDPSARVLFTKERSFSGMLHTRGFGIGARMGGGKLYFKKRFYEGEILTMNHPKQVRMQSVYYDGNPYVYGKLNSLYMLRVGIGLRKLLNDKPSSGGVQVAYYLLGGANLGLAFPSYLYIVHPDASAGSYLELEKYDPNKHHRENIFGPGPALSGFKGLKPYPGLYCKAALNFEFGEYHERIRALEIGGVLDVYAKAIPMMAHNKSSFLFANLYVSFNIGKKYN